MKLNERSRLELEHKPRRNQGATHNNSVKIIESAPREGSLVASRLCEVSRGKGAAALVGLEPVFFADVAAREEAVVASLARHLAAADILEFPVIVVEIAEIERIAAVMVGDARNLMDAVCGGVLMRQSERAIDLGARGEIEAPMVLAIDRLYMIADLEADDREITALAEQHAALGVLNDVEAEEFLVEAARSFEILAGDRAMRQHHRLVERFDARLRGSVQHGDLLISRPPV